MQNITDSIIHFLQVGKLYPSLSQAATSVSSFLSSGFLLALLDSSFSILRPVSASGKVAGGLLVGAMSARYWRQLTRFGTGQCLQQHKQRYLKEPIINQYTRILLRSCSIPRFMACMTHELNPIYVAKKSFVFITKGPMWSIMSSLYVYSPLVLSLQIFNMEPYGLFCKTQTVSVSSS